MQAPRRSLEDFLQKPRRHFHGKQATQKGAGERLEPSANTTPPPTNGLAWRRVPSSLLRRCLVVSFASPQLLVYGGAREAGPVSTQIPNTARRLRGTAAPFRLRRLLRKPESRRCPARFLFFGTRVQKAAPRNVSGGGSVRGGALFKRAKVAGVHESAKLSVRTRAGGGPLLRGIDQRAAGIGRGCVFHLAAQKANAGRAPLERHSPPKHTHLDEQQLSSNGLS